jgi:hypothetical protein
MEMLGLGTGTLYNDVNQLPTRSDRLYEKEGDQA